MKGGKNKFSILISVYKKSFKRKLGKWETIEVRQWTQVGYEFYPEIIFNFVIIGFLIYLCGNSLYPSFGKFLISVESAITNVVSFLQGFGG